jgi:CRP/FNR family transcriptional regulator, cyclic AMP receptor protein
MKAMANSSRIKSKEKPTFNVQAFLDSAGVARKIAEFRGKENIFSQGDSSKHVMYVQKGGVRLTVINEVGKEAVVAILGPGGFFARDA